jgi:hypothetical protein
MTTKLLTLFSCPKPFTHSHIATIQRNAVGSWVRLGDQVQVILMGNEIGVAEAAAEFGVRHIPDVACNEQGTPLISSMFDLARQHGDSSLLMYVNADILLLSDLLTAAQSVSEKLSRFLLVGQRWDLDVTEPLDFPQDWPELLRSFAQTHGRLHPPAGSDYFIFPRHCFIDIPAFAIGRAGWDNWMIYHALKSGFPAIDATEDVMIVHQNHDYSHLPGGKPHYDHPETDENIRLAGGREVTRFTLFDANKRLVDGRLRPRHWNLMTLRRWIESYPLLAWDNYALSEKITRLFWRIERKLRKN